MAPAQAQRRCYTWNLHSCCAPSNSEVTALEAAAQDTVRLLPKGFDDGSLFIDHQRETVRILIGTP
jgi:hypothetical protein